MTFEKSEKLHVRSGMMRVLIFEVLILRECHVFVNLPMEKGR